MDMYAEYPYIVVSVKKCSEPVSWLVTERGTWRRRYRMLTGDIQGRSVI
jgi:hypothetical protein